MPGVAIPAIDSRMYFGFLDVVVVEGGALERSILREVLAGFKVRSCKRFATTDDTFDYLKHSPAHLLIVGTAEGTMDAYAMIQTIRRLAGNAVRTMPIVLLTGHTQQSNVLRARDCGASFVVAKPITPAVLYGRIAWLARDRRATVEGGEYCGPDRRFQSIGPRAGANGRRATDLSLAVGETQAPKRPQEEINAMMNPKAIAL